jgi:PST family polysaccharide transporter
MLTVLAVLSVFRPIGWTTGSYLQATGRTLVLMGLELFKLAVLLTAIFLLAPLGALPACAAVGLAFGGHAAVGLYYLHRFERIPAGRMLGEIVRPLLACVPMAAAVLGARYLLIMLGLDNALVALGIEIVVGAASFVAAILWIAPRASRELVRLLRDAIRRSDRVSLPGQEPDPS